MTPKCPDCKRDQDDCICASPASAPEGFALVPVVPTHAILDVMFNAGIDRHDGDLTLLYRAMLAAAPTPPVSEDQKDAERFRFLQEDHAKKETRQKVRELFNRLPVMSLSAAREAIDDALGDMK